jgi:osmotically-inducible protein OsmY
LLIGLAAVCGCTTLSSDPRSRTTGAYIDDGVIESLVERGLYDADEAFESAHVVVVSYNGVVLLAGQVPSEALRETASQVAGGIDKVRRVQNELEVSGPTSILTRTSDAWLTSKVKSRLVADKQIQGTRVKVLTENGAVYLMGLIPREEGDRAAEIARRVYGVRKIVKVFEYL